MTIKSPVYHLMGILVEAPVDLGYSGDINTFPRLLVYSPSAGEFIDKDMTSREVEVTYDVIATGRNASTALRIAEEVQNYVIDNHEDAILEDGNGDDVFVIDSIVLNDTQCINEIGDSNRVIHRQLLNYTYTLTQL